MILALIAYLHGNGGAERQITMLANEMSKRGHEVHFLIIAEYSKRYPISERVIIHDLTKYDGSFLTPILGRFYALRNVYKTIKPDITIHFNVQSAYLTVALPKRIYGKAIYSERGDPYDDEYSGLLRHLRDWMVKKVDGLVFQSEGARDFFPAHIIKKSIIIHNSVAVPVDRYPISSSRKKVITSAGRLHPQKNYLLLIKAFIKISEDYPDYQLIIYGDGELRNDLQKYINAQDMIDRITLAPACVDLWDRIVDASLFVLSSDFEGMPNALMEAMALGVPCVSTDCRPGGARTLINNGINGFVVPCGDVDALAEKMSFVLSHPEVSQKISQGGRKIAYTHDVDNTYDKWETYIEFCCK